MSRTDKDRPYRVKVQDETYARDEDHDHRPKRGAYCVTHIEQVTETHYSWLFKEHRTRTYTVRRGYYHYAEPTCDLGEFPGQGKWYRWYNTQCGWSLPRHEARYYSTVPKWYVDHTWNNPERVRVRDRLREAAKSYNAGEELDDYDFPNHQHRHRARWLWS